jgi:glycerophosphoryl diester phosphodiesterase
MFRVVLSAFALAMSISGSAHAAAEIKVHGHRGARALRPENTLPAFEYAIKAGVDVLELDMAVTKDNVIVVSHDPLLSAPICTGPRDHQPIHDLTLAQIREYDCGAKRNPQFPRQQPVPGTKMPTLDEVFSMARSSAVEFNIETKISRDKPELAPSPEQFVKLVLAVIRKHKLENRVILQSFDFRTLHAMKSIAPEIRRSALVERNNDSFTKIAQEADATIVSPHYSLVTAEKVAQAHTAGLQIVPWTPNTPADWQKMIDANVDAIITDDPAALIAFLKKTK